MTELGSLTRWLTPEVSSLNRLPMGSPPTPFDSVDDARSATPSPWVRSLDGTWSFALAAGPDAVTAEQLAGPTDGWDDIAVPGSWVRQGYGSPIYQNIEMPFRLHPPAVPVDNPTGVYRRTFSVPRVWRTRRTLLRIGSADSMALVWVNGTFVGLGKDSRLPSTFELTDHLRPGSNDLAVVVPRWSDASWIEDQDQWWLPGLHRSVTLVSVPIHSIADAGLVPGLELDGTTGTLTVDVAVDAPRDDGAELTVEVVVEGDRRRVLGRLGPTAVPRFSDRHAALSAYLWPGHRVQAELAVPGVEPWSHEHPRRYRAFVVLRAGGEVVDVRTTQVGFRRVEVRDRALLINGQPVVLNGVNRHENHPDTGRTLTDAEVRRDLELMKQHHVNAVRTSHYPDGESFYDLCDELGLYVVDEANIESHGRWARLAWDPAYLPAMVERGVRMVQRDRSHPCVVIWSLGNESGDGPAQDASGAAIRRFDPSRPVQYEGPFFHGLDAAAPVTDIVCPMYASAPDIAAWSRAGRDPRRPLILCEYGHAMGQAGGLDAYWRVFGRLPGLQGGFVWEWADHGLRRHDPDGRAWLAYGGDFGEERHDSTFVCDGLVSPDREPHPLLTELAALAAPIGIERDRSGGLRVTNRRWFTGVDDLVASWTLTVDGRRLAHGPLGLPALGPQTAAVVADPAAGVALPPGEAELDIEIRPRRRPSWAPEGWQVATVQLPVRQPDVSAPSRRRSSRGVLAVSIDGEGPVVGGLALGWPQVSLWRAPTDNDDPPGAWRSGDTTAQRWRRLGLDDLEELDDDRAPRGATWVRTTTLATPETDPAAAGGGQPGPTVTVRHRQTLRLAGPGIRIDESIAVAGAGDLPRVGVGLVLPGWADRLEWFGLGPGDSYPDRRSASRIGRWRQSVATTPMPFVVPQETGLHLDTRWFALGPDGPPGAAERPTVVVWGRRPIAFSALPWSSLDLTEATHRHRLRPDGAVHVQLDVAHRGLGSAACGPDTDDRHRIGDGTYRWTWYVGAVAAGTDPGGLVALARSAP